MKLSPLFFRLFYIFLFALTVSFLFQFCAIQPEVWTPPTKPAFKNKLSLNEKLATSSKIDLQGWNGAEDFAEDSRGNLYFGVHKGEKDFSKGAILKMTPNGVISEFVNTQGWVTGIEFNKKGDLIALIQGLGLVKIDQQQKIESLVTKDAHGTAIKMGSGLTIASNGTIYFASLSATDVTSPKYINRLFLELKPTGGVYAFDPSSKNIRTISKGNFFANGVALAKDESFLLVSETSKYRVIRYWLKGEKAGTSDIFLDNLAGFPNNIVRRTNGNFWIGFTTKRNDQLDKIHPKSGMKKLIYGLPAFVQPKPERFGMILEITENGEIAQALFDTKGDAVMEAGSVAESNNKLYIGGDIAPYIAVYTIP